MRRGMGIAYATFASVFILLFVGIISCTNPLIDLVGTPEIRVKVNGELIEPDDKVDFGGVAGGSS
ncbi:MAG: hypothetical protein JW852_08840, partial [Spirochaetales bacterium]|nr:hypothetical protein [Spirochaetales bacterium]